MVSFQCDACQDVVKKPKLDQHRQRCGASFTCIDCSTTFSGPQQYKAHTSCISEAQKYEKALYKGPKLKGNGGFQNGRQNGGGFSKSYQRGPISSGPNGQPLGDKVKMTYTPPNEEEAPIQASTSVPAQAPLVPDPDAIIAAAANIAPESEVVVDKKVKIKKIKRKKEPPPPGETKAERKKRKKIERAARKAEKLKMKAQLRAAKVEATAAKKKEKEARAEERKMNTAADESAKDTAVPQEEVEVPASALDPPLEEVAKEKRKKKRKHLEDVSGDVNMPPIAENGGEPTEQAEQKKEKKKRSKEGKSDAATMEVDSTPALTNGHAEEESHGEKKSKKRKRDIEDVGGEAVVEEMADLSFKERAKAEKKARKAAKKARLAEQTAS